MLHYIYVLLYLRYVIVISLRYISIVNVVTVVSENFGNSLHSFFYF